MQPAQQLGPFCQSCGMPLSKPEDFGTEATGVRGNDYCAHCYANGKFLQPDATLTGMIAKCVDIVVQQGIMPEAQAEPLMKEMLPNLKRWRSGARGNQAVSA